MKIRNTLVVLFFIILLIGVIHQWKKISFSAPQAEPKELIGKQSELKNNSQLIRKKKILPHEVKDSPQPPIKNKILTHNTSPPKPSGNKNTYAIPRTDIPFTVVQDWAIAFGDVLLGKAEGAQPGQQGFHHPDDTRLWPTSIIPFGIHSDLKNPQRVTEAIRYFNENTAVRFVPVTDNDADAIIFIADEENCASYLGHIGGLQPILVAPQCQSQDLIHELMHALGFVHEHSRTDRDQFLEVLWDQIDPKYLSQFALIPDYLIHQYSGSVFNFDPHSVMLYPSTAFAKTPGRVTLRAKQNTPLSPATKGISAIDKERLFYLYGN